MKISIQTLGCKVNQSESAAIEGLLRENNYDVVKHDEGPDVCIINTCTVTAKSDYQSRQLIRRAARSGARVIATGCYAQLRSDDLSKIKGVNLLVGNSEKTNIIDHINKLSTDNGAPSTIICPPAQSLKYQPYHSTRSRAFLKIQDGCDSSCSYCTVPLARGMSRSLHPDDVTRSVENLAGSGYREVVLTGIHIGSYGNDITPAHSLVDLVTSLVSSFSQLRIRLSSIEPQEFHDEFLSLMKDGAVCRHLHIPLQSGSNRILKLMNRRYTTQHYAQLINSISTHYPDICIGTDIIAGFPGERDDDFQDTVKFVNELPISYFHIFPYSKRPGTPAAVAPDQIEVKITKERVAILREISKKKKYDYMMGNIDRTLDAIVEQRSRKRGIYKTLSDNYLNIFIESEDLWPGQRLKVRVISMTGDTLYGEPAE